MNTTTCQTQSLSDSCTFYAFLLEVGLDALGLLRATDMASETSAEATEERGFSLFLVTLLIYLLMLLVMDGLRGPAAINADSLLVKSLFLKCIVPEGSGFK